MTLTSQVPAVIDYLVAKAQASTSLGASPTARVRVIDGPPPTNDALTEQHILYIGWDQVNGTAGDDDAQSWKILDKGRTKEEDGTLTCTADTWVGNSVMKTARDAAFAIVAGVELLLRGDGTTGPGDLTMGGLVLWSQVETLRPYPRQDQQGAGFSCVFTITFRARLLTTGA